MDGTEISSTWNGRFANFICRQLSKLKEKQPDPSTISDPLETIQSLNAEYLAELNAIIGSYQSFFLPDRPATDDSDIGMSASNVSRRSIGSVSQKGSISNQDVEASVRLSEAVCNIQRVADMCQKLTSYVAGEGTSV